MKNAEVEKLEALAGQDPDYFFNIMPYAYVMGLSDKWAKQFANIKVPAPSWYYGNNAGDMIFTTMWYSSMSLSIILALILFYNYYDGLGGLKELLEPVGNQATMLVLQVGLLGSIGAVVAASPAFPVMTKALLNMSSLGRRDIVS